MPGISSAPAAQGYRLGRVSPWAAGRGSNTESKSRTSDPNRSQGAKGSSGGGGQPGSAEPNEAGPRNQNGPTYA